MPYIKQKIRWTLDIWIEKALIVLSKLKNSKIQGIKYLFMKILKDIYTTKKNYARLNEAIGLLVCCKDEFIRRYLKPYKPLKEIINKPIPEANEKVKWLLDIWIDHLITVIRQLRGSKAGTINYIFSVILKMTYITNQDNSYLPKFNEPIRILKDCKKEFQEEYLFPYEDKKIKENGDI